MKNRKKFAYRTCNKNLENEKWKKIVCFSIKFSVQQSINLVCRLMGKYENP
jgi:hypothetical protein